MAKAKQAPTITEQLRWIIRNSQLSLYRISRDSKVDYASLHKFQKGAKELHSSSIDKIAAVLDLQLVPRKEK
jgi:hypothetical protein